MKRFAVVSRGDFNSQRVSDNFVKRLTSHGWELSKEPELVIAVGGDGTMLEAFRMYQKLSPSYVGVSTGTLCFYMDWGKEEYSKLIEKILTEQPTIDEYPLLEVKVEHGVGKSDTFICLNDLVTKSKDIFTYAMELYINGERFESFRGDGVVVSAPCGSTAYNYSLGGSVLHPSIECLQVTELAAINNIEYRTLGRPFILSKNDELEIYPQVDDSNYLIGIDGVKCDVGDVHVIKARLASEKVKFARYHAYPFWTRVREKFIKQ